MKSIHLNNRSMKVKLIQPTETLKSVVPIDYVEQNNDGGFSGEDIELKAFYTDPADAENLLFF